MRLFVRRRGALASTRRRFRAQVPSWQCAPSKLLQSRGADPHELWTNHRAIWETLSPSCQSACQCLSSSTTSTTANILLAIRAPLFDLLTAAHWPSQEGVDAAPKG